MGWIVGVRVAWHRLRPDIRPADGCGGRARHDQEEVIRMRTYAKPVLKKVSISLAVVKP
jgi:hypothetical protein